jgi:hypothetical protein
MNRPRIQTQPEKVISVRGRIVFSRELKTTTEYYIRKVSFLKTRDKINVVTEVTPNLISFNLGCAKAINDFKKSKI